MNKKTICFDIDNVICKTIKNKYSKSKPKKDVIELINKLYDEGYHIKILTARYSGRFNDDFKKVKSYGYLKTLKQLKTWGLKFHKLYMTKPSYDFFVDDKSYNFDKKWMIDVKKRFL
jgi:hypothetical protein